MDREFSEDRQFDILMHFQRIAPGSAPSPGFFVQLPEDVGPMLERLAEVPDGAGVRAFIQALGVTGQQAQGLDELLDA